MKTDVRHAKLRITTPSEREIAMSRDFNAPRHLVWDAMTRPELVKRWLGTMQGWYMDICDIDLRVGGSYRYLWRGPEGAQMGMRGVYREIVPHQRIVSTEKYDESWYEGDAMDTATLESHGATTTLTITVLYGSRDVRDAVLRSPMESGVSAGFDALEALLASHNS
jgi:uncharacterized protein YndB with AHSA1/START domain